VESYYHSSLVSHGSFGAYRKELLPKLGEAITADDSECVVNVIRNGYRAIVDPQVKCEEQELSSIKEWEDQKKRRAAGVIRVLLTNFGMILNRKYGAFGYLTIPIEFFLLVLTPILSIALFGLLTVLVFTSGSILLISALLSFYVILILLVKFSTKARVVYELYLCCFLGLFQAFTKKKTWK
jgi:cellulose synthase/poly-beta-1,6-N-acetylglucosamine synthase-like glycosyltransferase